ncbi:MAG: hypothetical protein ACRD2Z_05960 [Thermoanaerobaculia bacterium]
MKLHVKGFGVALAVALLALAPAVAVVAQEEEYAAEEETTLTGQLSTDEQGGYVLIEEASGESVSLVASMDLSQHVDATVNVTGKWAEDEEGNRVFEVSSVEPAE